MKKIIAVYTFSPFPCGDANANRILAYALSMQDINYKVIILTNSLPREEDFISETGIYSYMGVEYRSYFKPGIGKIKRVLHRNNIAKFLNEKFLPDEYKNIVLCCTSYRNYGIYVHFVLKHRGIPVVVDVSEWHSSSQFKLGILNPQYIMHTLKNRFLLPRAKNIICITSFLENYYKRRGCNTIYLPPQIILDSYAPHSFPKLPPVRFFYAGSMQKKDYMWVAFEGFMMLTDKEMERIQFTLAGSDVKEFLSQIPKGEYYLKRLKNNLHIIGKITKQQVQEYLTQSHFLMLLRPVSRYSTAGFPSKVPEALAAGVPVITNLTSDLGKFIVDGENGFIAEEFNAQAFVLAVRKAIQLDDESFQRMSENAYQCAKNFFTYSTYNDTIKKYLSDICE